MWGGVCVSLVFTIPLHAARRGIAADSRAIYPPLNRVPSPATCESCRGPLISFHLAMREDV